MLNLSNWTANDRVELMRLLSSDIFKKAEQVCFGEFSGKARGNDSLNADSQLWNQQVGFSQAFSALERLSQPVGADPAPVGPTYQHSLDDMEKQILKDAPQEIRDKLNPGQ